MPETLDLSELKKFLPKLTYREREIIKLRYGLADTEGYIYTLREAGIVFKITRERVRQIEAKAIRKLRIWME